MMEGTEEGTEEGRYIADRIDYFSELLLVMRLVTNGLARCPAPDRYSSASI